ncbi:putative O-glycosylation ligase, exosortase A system-associated [Pleionea sp. CnH1-48]|nr:putative O-glycosylation ligase, exosortase A system-associated [Pleionea sp. CnH1-48]
MAFRRPIYGVLTWACLNFMSPHRLSWGFLSSLPVVVGVSAISLLTMFISKDKSKFYWNNLSILMLLFTLHFSITTIFAWNPDGAFAEWDRFVKSMVFIVVVIILVNTREKIVMMVAAIAISFGFYGVKGGIFAVLTAGNHRVWGPVGTFIEDNNHLGLALLMTVPLMVFLRSTLTVTWQRHAVLGATAITVVAVLMTYSRGAMLATVAMGFIALMRSKQRIKGIVAIAIIGSLALPLVPQQWFDRMNTLKAADEDESAMGRVNSWYYAFHLANDYPLTGGGARVFTPYLFATTSYAPEPDRYHDAHSIYFEILGEQGWVGLAIFLSIFIGGGLKAQKLRKLALKQGNKDMSVLSDCLWYSLFAYGTAGTFLGLGYFDYPYTIIALLIVVERHLKEEQAAKEKPKLKSMM